MEFLSRYGWLFPVVTVVASLLVFMGLWGGVALLFVRVTTVIAVLTLAAQVAAAFLFLRRKCYRTLPLICFGLLVSGCIASLGVFWNWSHIW